MKKNKEKDEWKNHRGAKAQRHKVTKGAIF
jgi:hypothetical protein